MDESSVLGKPPVTVGGGGGLGGGDGNADGGGLGDGGGGLGGGGGGLGDGGLGDGGLGDGGGGLGGGRRDTDEEPAKTSGVSYQPTLSSFLKLICWAGAGTTVVWAPLAS